jgi:hypothetical protein
LHPFRDCCNQGHEPAVSIQAERPDSTGASVFIVYQETKNHAKYWASRIVP